MQFINDEIDTHQPWKFSIAGDMQNEPRLTQPRAEAGRLDSQWDAGFVHPVRSILAQADDAHRNMYTRPANTHLYNGNPLERVISPNHTMRWQTAKRACLRRSSLATLTNVRQKTFTLGAAIMFTSPVFR
jgi:1,4-alpha-glucan branching enzyme